MSGELFATEQELGSRIARLDATLTPEEIAAETYLEWPDTTLAQSVRELAKDIDDCNGRDAVIAHSGALTLIGTLKECQGGKMTIKVEDKDGRSFVVTVSENEGPDSEPSEPRMMIFLENGVIQTIEADLPVSVILEDQQDDDKREVKYFHPNLRLDAQRSGFDRAWANASAEADEYEISEGGIQS